MSLSSVDDTLVKTYDVNFTRLILDEIEPCIDNQLVSIGGFPTSLCSGTPSNMYTPVPDLIVYDVHKISVAQNNKSSLPYFNFMVYCSPDKIKMFKERSSTLESPNSFVNRISCTPDAIMSALVDSGSQTSLCSQSLLSGFNCKLEPCDSSIRLKGFSGDALFKPLGVVNLYIRSSLRLPVAISFLVLPDSVFASNAIIGYPDTGWYIYVLIILERFIVCEPKIVHVHPCTEVCQYARFFP